MTTIYDVAQLAGVSHTAVSAVINGRKNQVGAEKRQKILNAIDKLNYRPNRVARQLATGRFNTIAVCFERPYRHIFVNPIDGPLIAGVGDAAADIGSSLLIIPADPHREFKQIIKDMPAQGVDGAIVMGAILLDKAIIRAIDNCEVPIVCIDSYPGFSCASTVDIDNSAGMRRGIEYLIAQGHKRIMFLGPPPEFQCQADRMRAFCEVMQEHDLLVDEHLVRITPEERVEDMLIEVLQSDHCPTALACAMGAIGTSAWNAVQAAGLRVPNDISILVFDGLPAGHPGEDCVSIIRPVPYQMGSAATNILRRILADELQPPISMRLPAEILLRPSPTRHNM